MRVFNFVWLIPLLLFSVPLVYGAEIPYYYVDNGGTETTTSTSYVDVDEILIQSGNFTAGRDYLILATGMVDMSASSGEVHVKMIHGSTDFADSENIIEPPFNGYHQFYNWITVWEAVDSEDVKMQFKASTGTATVRWSGLTIMEISEDLTENTDWFISTNSTNQNLSTAWTTGNPSITFTPDGTDKWMVIGMSRTDVASVTTQYETRINFDDSEFTPMLSREGEDATNEFFIHTPVRIYTPSNAEHTWEVESRQDDATGTGVRTDASIFMLNINKFETAEGFFDDNENASTGCTTRCNEAITDTITPSQTGDVFIYAFVADDNQSTGTNLKVHHWQTQINNTDSPFSQATRTDSRLYVYDGDDILGMARSWVANMDTTNHTIDLDYDHGTSITGDPEYEYGSMISFTMELASGGSPTYVVDLLDVYESESTTLGSGNVVCLNIDLEIADECEGVLIVGHTYRFEIEVDETAGNSGTPTTIDIDASIADYDLFGNVVVGEIIDSGCSTNTNWTESIVSADVRATSGTGCALSSSTAEFWIIIKIHSDAGSGAKPTATFTIDDGTDSDTSTTTTFNIDNITE